MLLAGILPYIIRSLQPRETSYEYLCIEQVQIAPTCLLDLRMWQVMVGSWTPDGSTQIWRVSASETRAEDAAHVDPNMLIWDIPGPLERKRHRNLTRLTEESELFYTWAPSNNHSWDISLTLRQSVSLPMVKSMPEVPGLVSGQPQQTEFVTR